MNEELEIIDVADRIKHLRTHLRFTQTELGKAAGVSKAAVSQWERGLSKPERDALLSLEESIGVNPQWINIGKGGVFSHELFSEDTIQESKGDYKNVRLIELKSIFVNLSVDAQSQILSLAKLLSIDDNGDKSKKR